MSFIGLYQSTDKNYLRITLKNNKIYIRCQEPYIKSYGVLTTSDKNNYIAIFADNFNLKDIGVYLIYIVNHKKVTLRSYNINNQVASKTTFRRSESGSHSKIEPNEFYSNEISLSNEITQSIRYSPYQELIFPINGKNVAYTSLSTTDQLTSNVSENFIVSPNVLRNDKRTTLFDMAIILNQKETKDYPLYKKVYFDTRNTKKAYTILERTAITTVTDSTPPYTEIFSDRYNKWVYYPNTIVYTLADLNNNKIYLMQTYSNIVSPDINNSTLPLLSQKLTLPNGWIYGYIRINQDKYLVNNSGGEAILVTDNFNNSYQYISPKQAPFIYENLKDIF